MDQPTDQPPVPAKSDPGPRTLAALEAGVAAYQAMPMRVSVQFEAHAGGHAPVAPHNDPRHLDQLRAALGTSSSDFLVKELGTLEFVTRTRGAVDVSAPNLNAALALVEAVAPRNELEGAIAIQMASNHSLTIEMLGKAKHADTTDKLALFGNLAVKLQRTFTAQVEALAKLRGGGQQTVRVEHVTVAAGAQAIIGEVHHHGRGAGASEKAETQPHGQHQEGARRAALPGPDPTRDGVSVPGDAERPLPHPRRKVTRRADRQSKRAQARKLES